MYENDMYLSLNSNKLVIINSFCLNTIIYLVCRRLSRLFGSEEGARNIKLKYFTLNKFCGIINFADFAVRVGPQKISPQNFFHGSY